MVKLDDQPVPDPASLLKRVEGSTVGQLLPLTVIRGQRELNLSIKPAALPKAS